MIRASKLLRKKVVDSENNELGLLVNVIFNIDPDFLYARMLVFPYKPCKLVKTFQEFVKETTIEAIGEHLPSDSPKIAKTVAKKGPEVAFKAIEDHQQEKENKSLITYYLIPFSKVVDINQEPIDQIRLTISCEECENESRKLRNGDYPFFEARSFDEIETTLTTTLSRQPVEGLKGSLQNGKKGLIVDLELDCDSDCVKNLIIETYGSGAGENRVSAKKFNFPELNLEQQAFGLTSSGGT